MNPTFVPIKNKLYSRRNIAEMLGMTHIGSDSQGRIRPDLYDRSGLGTASYFKRHDWAGVDHYFIMITNTTKFADTVNNQGTIIKWIKSKRFKDEFIIGKRLHVFQRNNPKDKYTYLGKSQTIYDYYCEDSHVILHLNTNAPIHLEPIAVPYPVPAANPNALNYQYLLSII